MGGLPQDYQIQIQETIPIPKDITTIRRYKASGTTRK
jgi:hypothetical protein